jgi:hypothetical protein
LNIVEDPMDFDKMLTKLDEGEYKCAQGFLTDIDLIANNAISYNSDLNYETNKIICHRARALQDFCYALVKAEMDTDFEDECKEIVERRKKLSKELDELSPDDEEDAANGTNVQARKKRRPRQKKSAWAKGSVGRTRRKRAKQEDDEGEEEEEEEEGKTGDNGEEEDGSEENGEAAEEMDVDEQRGKTRSASTEVVRNANCGGASSTSSSTRSSPKEHALAPTAATASSSRSSSSGGANMVPTGGVRIDHDRLNKLQKEVTRITDDYNVERLERVFSLLMGVVGKFAALTDRTELPAEMQLQLDALKTTRSLIRQR